MTHDPMKTPLAMLLGVALMSTAIAGCIAPQAPCVCPSSSAPSAASGSDTSSKSSSSSNSTPAAKPTGTLIFDGKSAGILNVNPGGSWFSMNDKTSKGKMVPEGNDFATVLHGGAVHTSGKGYTDWGGGIGFNFVGADALTLLDASAYTGLSFKLSGSTPVHIGLATKATMPEFGDCTKCYDHYSTDITNLEATPKVYTFKWAQLRAGGWGSPKAAFDPHTLVGLNFTSKGAMAWDFAIHEISFTQ
jgi:hypothetical protein